MTTAHEAYQHWIKAKKVNLQVFTDEQMFTLGFEAAKTIMNEMEHVIKEMERETQKLKAEIKKLRKIAE